MDEISDSCRNKTYIACKLCFFMSFLVALVVIIIHSILKGPQDIILEVVEGPILPEKSPYPGYKDSLFGRNITSGSGATHQEFNVTARLVTYEKKRHELAHQAGIITDANFNESRRIKDLNEIRESNFNQTSKRFFIHQNMVNVSEAERVCDLRQMKLVRFATKQKYEEIVHFARLWLYQMYLQLDLKYFGAGKWHRTDFWTAMIYSTDQPERSKNNTMGYAFNDWMYGFPIPLQRYPNNIYIAVEVNSDLYEPKQGMSNYGPKARKRPFCESLSSSQKKSFSSKHN